MEQELPKAFLFFLRSTVYLLSDAPSLPACLRLCRSFLKKERIYHKTFLGGTERAFGSLIIEGAMLLFFFIFLY